MASPSWNPCSHFPRRWSNTDYCRSGRGRRTFGGRSLEYTRQLAQFAAAAPILGSAPARRRESERDRAPCMGGAVGGQPAAVVRGGVPVCASQGGAPQSTVVNFGLKTSAMNAAFVNGTFGHGFRNGRQPCRHRNQGRMRGACRPSWRSASSIEHRQGIHPRDGRRVRGHDQDRSIGHPDADGARASCHRRRAVPLERRRGRETACASTRRRCCMRSASRQPHSRGAARVAGHRTRRSEAHLTAAWRRPAASAPHCWQKKD